MGVASLYKHMQWSVYSPARLLFWLWYSQFSRWRDGPRVSTDSQRKDPSRLVLSVYLVYYKWFIERCQRIWRIHWRSWSRTRISRGSHSGGVSREMHTAGRGRSQYCRLVVGRYCVPQENHGYKLISKMGWCRGRGLGRKEQGKM